MLLKELVAKIILDASGFKGGAEETKSAAKLIEESLGGVATKATNTSSILEKVWSGVAGAANAALNVIKIATLGISGVLTASTYAAAKFETSMFDAWKTASSGANASGKAWEDFQTAARDTAAAVGTHADKIGNMYKAIADRGFDASETIRIGAETAKLAKALNIDYAASGENVAKAMKIFAHENLSAARASNILAVAATVGNLSVEDMGMAFNTVIPLAERTGTSFATISAILGELGKSIGGYRAVFALGTIMQDMQDQTSGFGKALKEQGINTMDATGKLRPLANILSDMKKFDTTKLPMQMASIVEALKKINLNESLSKMAGGGTAFLDRQLADRKKTIGGSLETLAAAFGQVFSTIGQSFAKFLVPVINDLSNRVITFVKVLQETGIISKFFESLKSIYESKIIPMFDALSTKIKSWSEGMTPERVQGWIDAFASGVTSLIDLFTKLYELIKKIVDSASKVPEAAKRASNNLKEGGVRTAEALPFTGVPLAAARTMATDKAMDRNWFQKAIGTVTLPTRIGMEYFIGGIGGGGLAGSMRQTRQNMSPQYPTVSNTAQTLNLAPVVSAAQGLNTAVKEQTTMLEQVLGDTTYLWEVSTNNTRKLVGTLKIEKDKVKTEKSLRGIQ